MNVVPCIPQGGFQLTGVLLVSDFQVAVAKGTLRRVHSVEKELCGGVTFALSSPIARVEYAPPPPETANAEVVDRIRAARAVLFGCAARIIIIIIFPSISFHAVVCILAPRHRIRFDFLLLRVSSMSLEDTWTNPRCMPHMYLRPGSLYTSIMPSLVLPGVGESVADMPEGGLKIIMLNAGPDRETSGMCAVSHLEALVKGLNRS